MKKKTENVFLDKITSSFVSGSILCIFINDLFICHRAAIERENKDVRLEQIRVQAHEQRETVLQSIK